MNGMYEELLEKLRKNNRMSGWTHIDRLIDEAAEAIEALQHEVKKIPQICPQKPCYFDMTAEGRDADFMQELVDGHCMRICPKWKEKWGT